MEAWVVLDRVLDVLKQVGLSSTPPEIGDRVHRIVRREVGDGDPYRATREASTRQALVLYPRLKALLAEADDPLGVAVRLSIAGNIINLGPDQQYDLWDEKEVSEMPGFDGTGPRGQGPMTGRGEGYCAMVLPESGQAPYGYAGLQGTPVRLGVPAARPALGTRFARWQRGRAVTGPPTAWGAWKGRGRGRGAGRGRSQRFARW